MAMTTDHWIGVMQQYPRGTLVRFIGEALVFDNPDGTPAKPVGAPEQTEEVGIKS